MGSFLDELASQQRDTQLVKGRLASVILVARRLVNFFDEIITCLAVLVLGK